MVDARYEAEWAEGVRRPRPTSTELLRAALGATRRQELDRGVTLVGPHRDDWRLTLDGLDGRTHASQGEQRTLALALRLAGHRVCAEVVGEHPVLLLDDVFSELDAQRAGGARGAPAGGPDAAHDRGPSRRESRRPAPPRRRRRGDAEAG